MKKSLTFLLMFALSIAYLAGLNSCGSASAQPNPPAEIYNRVLIKRVTLKSFPALKPDGRRWDNWSAGYQPDIYVVLQDNSDGSILYSNPNQRFENAHPTSGVSFPMNYTLSNLSNVFYVTFYDLDDLTEHDLVGQMVFRPQLHTGQTLVSSTNRGAEIELELEWLTSR